MKKIHKERMEYKASLTTQDWTKRGAHARFGENDIEPRSISRNDSRKSCGFCWLLCYSSIQNLILLRWVYPDLDRDQTERSSLSTRRLNTLVLEAEKKVSCDNTKSITKHGLTAFEIIYLHILRVNWATCSSGQEKAWSSFFVFFYIYIL